MDILGTILNKAGSIVGKLGLKILNKKPTMNIIDVSHHNGKINWFLVASQISPFKVDGAIIKTSTGVGSYDPRAAYNAVQAKNEGLKIGYYHYCSLNEENELKDAVEEANSFINILSTLPKPDFPLVLDIEDPKILPSLTDIKIYNWIKKFFSVLESKGYTDYVLYSFTPFLNEHLPANHDLGKIRLWIAQYRTTLTLPRGWKDYWLWQKTDKGNIRGIIGNVDLNKTK